MLFIIKKEVNTFAGINRLCKGNICAGIVAADNSVVLIIQERAGVLRSGEYLDVGILGPRSWNIKDASKFRLSDATGLPVAAQFKILSRCGNHAGNTAAPAKWVLVGFFTDVGAVSTTTVNTGSALFEINKTGNENLINQVIIDEKSVLTPLTSGATFD